MKRWGGQKYKRLLEVKEQNLKYPEIQFLTGHQEYIDLCPPKPASEFKDYDKINRKLSFLKIILLNNVKYNTRLVAYSIAPDILSGYLTKHFTYKHYKINIKIPYYCKYARGNYMYVNKIKFRPVRV